jgi:hypothetical protein
MTSYPTPNSVQPSAERATYPDSALPGELAQPVTPYSQATYQPTAEQLARDAELKRYNRQSITIPVVIISLIAIGLFILLMVMAFGLKDTGQARELIAGLSALTIIFISIPLIVFMTVLPIAYIAWWYNRREQRKLYPETGPMAYRSRVQILLWQIDSFLVEAQQQVERGSDAMTKPLIRAHVLWARGEGFLRGIDQNFTRSEPNDQYNNPSAGD